MILIPNHLKPPEYYLDLALAAARQGAALGEVPVGAVLVDGTGSVIATAHNQVEQQNNPLKHAEMLVLEAAHQGLKDTRYLSDYTLYVTLEPCPLCAAAIALYRLKALYFGAYDPKGGGVVHGAKVLEQPTCHHTVQIVGGVREQECVNVLKNFFENKRTVR
jgi:tRNA(adenine34) deaminase